MGVNQKVAVVGISCNFPEAPSKNAFWYLLANGQCAIRTAPSSREAAAKLFKMAQQEADHQYPLQGGFIKGFDHFDHEFFLITPREAKYMDPQQRLLLQLTWHALEDACINPTSLKDSNTGVFIGVMGNEWGQIHFNALDKIDRYIGTGSGYCLLANRISYHYQLQGPSMAIDTACSSSLIAIDRACKSLLNYETDLAIAGGVNLILTPALSLYYLKAGLLAADGCSKPFANAANGIGRGEGGGIVILKRLEDALADKDNIYAVICGSAVNHNGSSNGIMAPSQTAQRALLTQAYKNAEVDPIDLNFIEAHGTGTLIGDPIEASALGSVIGSHRTPDKPCKIGSVKGNIGHLEGAAGIAGFIKTALCLYYKTLVPSLFCEPSNRYINFAKNHLSIQKEFEKIPKNTPHLYAGVSSFGLGGANAHLVLSDFDNKQVEGLEPRPVNILKVSAKSASTLQSLISQLASQLKQQQAKNFTEFCALYNTTRPDFKYREAFVGDKNLVEQQLQQSLSQPNGDINPLPGNFTEGNELASLIAVQHAYKQSEVIDWKALYPIKTSGDPNLPLYPFESNFYDLNSPVAEFFASYPIAARRGVN